MTATRLIQRRVEKVWGRWDVPAMFADQPAGRDPLGEVWFEHPTGRDDELLVKYLFTSEPLSIQVHPADAAARRAGYPRGKDEAWYVADAEAGAMIGLGLTASVSKQELAAAARNGRVEQLVHWRPVTTGEVIYSPGGTVHALGAGLVIIEIQQNVDLTYRLYDYGRPRALHVEEAVNVADTRPYCSPVRRYEKGGGREILADGGSFVLERWRGWQAGQLRATNNSPAWLIPVRGDGVIDGNPLLPGTVWVVDRSAQLVLSLGAELLVAYAGSRAADQLID